MNYKIPLSKPYTDTREIEVIKEVLESSVLSLGPGTELFEQRLAALVGRKYGVAVNSGTSGLHLAVKALGLGEGDEVITSPFSFIASANCLLYEKAKPVFLDIEEDTLGMDPDMISSKISEKTKGILPVHVFGQPNKALPEMVKLSEDHDLKIIEDACEALFGECDGKPIGSFGDASVFGFYPNKQITTGEGGMVVTDNEEVYHTIKSLRNQGRSSMQTMEFTQLGYNYRISELTAALGLAQLEKTTDIKRKRSAAAELYLDELKDVDEIVLPKQFPNMVHSWFLFTIRVRSQWRDLLVDFLNKNGIQCKAYFDPCIHLQPFYRKKFGYKEGGFPVAEQVSKEIMALPFYTGISADEIKIVVNTLKSAIHSFR